MRVQLMKKIIFWSLCHIIFGWYCVYGDPSEAIIECPKQGWTCHQQSNTRTAISALHGFEGVVVTHKGYPQLTVSISCKSYEGNQLNFPRGLLKQFSWQPVTNYLFVQCPPPQNITFAEILEGHKIETLRWTSARPIGDSLDAHIFRGLTGLQSLNLADCGLTSLPKDFSNLFTNLSRLRLNYNNFSDLPHDTFAAFKALTLLELSNNDINQLTNTFKGLKRLQKLYLYHNQIKQISRTFLASMPSIEIIDLQDNQLTSLPFDLLYDVPSLKTLRLFKNRLQEIPLNFLQFQNQLIELDISDNPQINSLPPTLLHNLTSLSKLNINRCSLRMIPANFFQSKQLISLSNLQLDHNELDELEPGLFQELRNMLTLDLSYNNLKTLGRDSLGSLHQLTVLQLKHNQLSNIDPLSFSGLPELKILDISMNNLTTIPEDALMQIEGLEELNLKNNRLSYSEFTQSPFKLAPQNIRAIDLSYNKLKGLPIAWLRESVHLKKLNLSHNQFEYFNANECEPVSDSVVIYLNNNKITNATIDIHVSDMLAEHSVTAVGVDTPLVVLGHNPFICDCHANNLLYYHRYQSRRRYPFVIDIDNLQCSSPSSLIGREVATVKMAELQCEIFEDCPPQCKCLQHALGNVVEVDCRHENLTEPPLKVPFNSSVLHFESNHLTNMSGFEKPHWAYLKELYLSNNKIRLMDANLLPENVNVLDLQENQLSNLTTANLQMLDERPRMKVLLQKNPWVCNCEAKDFKLWLNENVQKVGNVSNILCNATHRPVYMEDICPLPLINTKAILVGATVISLVLAIGLATAGIGYYRYRHAIKVWLYAHRWCMWFVTEHEVDREKTYDAFVSFSQEDAEFVASHLLPGLESGEPTYKVCIHHRDWLAGEWIPDQIVRSVQDSRRTIVILSKNFIRSVWGRLEFKAAHHQALQDRMNRIIIIVIGEVPSSSEMDPELKMYVKFNTYLKWGDPWFWQKLRYAMPHSPLCMPPKRSTTMNHLSSTITDQPRIPMSCIGTSITNSISEDKLELVCT